MHGSLSIREQPLGHFGPAFAGKSCLLNLPFRRRPYPREFARVCRLRRPDKDSLAMKQLLWTVVALLALGGGAAFADEPAPAPDPAKTPAMLKDVIDATGPGDTAWMLISSALVLLMVPGLALF